MGANARQPLGALGMAVCLRLGRPVAGRKSVGLRLKSKGRLNMVSDGLKPLRHTVAAFAFSIAAKASD